MQSKLLTGLLAATIVSVATAQTQNAAPAVKNGVVTPTVPAPAAPTQAAPVAPGPAETNAVTQVVYAPKLPTAAELKAAAESQGLKLERVVQTQIQVIAFYRNAAGQETTVAYQSVPPTGAVAPTAAPATVVTQAPTIVYQTAPRVVYYDDYPYTSSYYYPRYYYPPVSLSLGFGFGRGYYGGGYYGGYRHHWR